MAKIFWNMTVRNSDENPINIVVTHGDGWGVIIDARDASVVSTLPGRDGSPNEAQIRKAVEFASIHGWV
jgi:hypothetical protein